MIHDEPSHRVSSNIVNNVRAIVLPYANVIHVRAKTKIAREEFGKYKTQFGRLPKIIEFLILTIKRSVVEFVNERFINK